MPVPSPSACAPPGCTRRWRRGRRGTPGRRRRNSPRPERPNRAGPSPRENLRRMAKAKVTAGLMWAPAHATRHPNGERDGEGPAPRDQQPVTGRQEDGGRRLGAVRAGQGGDSHCHRPVAECDQADASQELCEELAVQACYTPDRATLTPQSGDVRHRRPLALPGEPTATIRPFPSGMAMTPESCGIAPRHGSNHIPPPIPYGPPGGSPGRAPRSGRFVGRQQRR